MMSKEFLLSAGEYGAMPQAARNWAETGALLCEVLAAELEAVGKGSLPQAAPAQATLPSNPHAAQQPSEPFLQPKTYEQNGSSYSHKSAAVMKAGEGLLSAEDIAVNPGATVSASGQTCDTSAHHAGPQSGSRLLFSHEQGAAPGWPQVIPADEEMHPAGQASIPEAPAELASVLCATWHALLPAEICSSAAALESLNAAEQRDSAMPGGNHSGEAENEHTIRGQSSASSQAGSLSKQQKQASDSAGDALHPAVTAGGVPAASSSGAAGRNQHVGPKGQGLDFRLLGEPAGFTSCHGQPSSQAGLLAALKSQPGMAGQARFCLYLAFVDLLNL